LLTCDGYAEGFEEVTDEWHFTDEQAHRYQGQDFLYNTFIAPFARLKMLMITSISPQLHHIDT
jgi:hypothetical protein